MAFTGAQRDAFYGRVKKERGADFFNQNRKGITGLLRQHGGADMNKLMGGLNSLPQSGPAATVQTSGNRQALSRPNLARQNQQSTSPTQPVVPESHAASLGDFQSSFNATQGQQNYNPQWDYNKDGVINFTDFLQYRENPQGVQPDPVVDPPGPTSPVQPVVAPPTPTTRDMNVVKHENAFTRPLENLGQQQADLANRFDNLSATLLKLQEERNRPDVDINALLQGFQNTLSDANKPYIDQLEQHRLAQNQFINDFQARQQHREGQLNTEAQNERARNQALNQQLEQHLAQRFAQQGQPDAITQAELLRLGTQKGDAEAALTQRLKSLGVLRGSGAPIDRFGELEGGFAQAEADIRGQGQLRDERAFDAGRQLLGDRRATRADEARIREAALGRGVQEMGLGLNANQQLQNQVSQSRQQALQGLTNIGAQLGNIGGQDTLENVFGSADRSGQFNGADTLDQQRVSNALNLGQQQIDTTRRGQDINQSNFIGQQVGRFGDQNTVARDRLDMEQAAGIAGGGLDILSRFGVIPGPVGQNGNGGGGDSLVERGVRGLWNRFGPGGEGGGGFPGLDNLLALDNPFAGGGDLVSGFTNAFGGGGGIGFRPGSGGFPGSGLMTGGGGGAGLSNVASAGGRGVGFNPLGGSGFGAGNFGTQGPGSLVNFGGGSSGAGGLGSAASGGASGLTNAASATTHGPLNLSQGALQQAGLAMGAGQLGNYAFDQLGLESLGNASKWAGRGAALGSVVPGLGTLAGGLAGGAFGLATGLFGGGTDPASMDNNQLLRQIHRANQGQGPRARGINAPLVAELARRGVTDIPAALAALANTERRFASNPGDLEMVGQETA